MSATYHLLSKNARIPHLHFVCTYISILFNYTSFYHGLCKCCRTMTLWALNFPSYTCTTYNYFLTCTLLVYYITLKIYKSYLNVRKYQLLLNLNVNINCILFTYVYDFKLLRVPTSYSNSLRVHN